MRLKLKPLCLNTSQLPFQTWLQMLLSSFVETVAMFERGGGIPFRGKVPREEERGREGTRRVYLEYTVGCCWLCRLARVSCIFQVESSSILHAASRDTRYEPIPCSSFRSSFFFSRTFETNVISKYLALEIRKF